MTSPTTGPKSAPFQPHSSPKWCDALNPTATALDDDPQLIAVAIVAMLNQFCYLQLTGPDAPDDEACITTLTNIFYRAIYYKEGR